MNGFAVLDDNLTLTSADAARYAELERALSALGRPTVALESSNSPSPPPPPTRAQRRAQESRDRRARKRSNPPLTREQIWALLDNPNVTVTCRHCGTRIEAIHGWSDADFEWCKRRGLR